MNIHHGNDLHPYINYPFIETERMKRFVQAAAQKGIGVKVYYTAREMSNHTAEVFCYKAFGKEIILQQKGQGLDTFHDREWLHRYFGENVIPAWQVHYRSGPHKGDDDIAFIIQRIPGLRTIILKACNGWWIRSESRASISMIRLWMPSLYAARAKCWIR